MYLIKFCQDRVEAVSRIEIRRKMEAGGAVTRGPTSGAAGPGQGVGP